MTPQDRLEQQARSWRVDVDRVVETDTSVLAFGRRAEDAVVLKLIRQPCDEWFSGDVLEAFAGHGVVRVLDHVDGAVLLERLNPGTSLASMSMNHDDDRATALVADVIGRMAPRRSPDRVPSVRTWARGFDRYLAGRDDRVPRALVESARAVYLDLLDHKQRCAFFTAICITKTYCSMLGEGGWPWIPKA